MNTSKDLNQLEDTAIRLDEMRDKLELDKARFDALERLRSNSDFLYLFEEQYFNVEAANGVKIMDSEMAYNNPTLARMNEAKIVGISALQRWLNYISIEGRMYDSRLASLEEEIDNVQ